MIYIVNENIVLDTDRNSISVNGIIYRIDEKETCLLKYLIDNKNCVCSYDKIIKEIYGENDKGLGRNNLTTYISRIKRKTQRTLDKYIITHTGKGYEFSIGNEPTIATEQNKNYSVEHISIDNDYYVHHDSVEFIKHFTTKVTTFDARDIYSIHFRVTWFADESVDVIPLTSNVQDIKERTLPDTNRNYNIVFKEPVSNGQIIEYAIKVTCTNVHQHFQNFFSTQVIVPIANLHIHLHLDNEPVPRFYSTQVLSDSLNNQATEEPIEHEYFCPVHWHIVDPKLHFEYKIFW